MQKRENIPWLVSLQPGSVWDNRELYSRTIDARLPRNVSGGILPLPTNDKCSLSISHQNLTRPAIDTDRSRRPNESVLPSRIPHKGQGTILETPRLGLAPRRYRH